MRRHLLNVINAMSDDIVNTIEVLTARVSAKEDEANKLKKLVNELCVEAGLDARYPDVPDAGGTLGTIRSDQFYGQTLTAAIRNYLERRKASNLGAASVTEIYRSIKDGGYKFETKSEDIARISVANALRKTSSIFHRLPNGHYGLLTWYPTAKAQPDIEETKPKLKRAKKHIAAGSQTNGTLINAKEVRDVILEQTGEFQSTAIEAAVRSKFPTRELHKTKVPTVLFTLKKQGLIKEISPKSGTKGAVYAKI